MLADVAWQLLTSSLVFLPIERVAERRLLITGAGPSEGAARYLATILRDELSLSASFLPASSFLKPREPREDDILIVFSRGISPSASVVLDQCRRFTSSVLFTGVHPEGRSPEARLVARLRDAGTVVHVLPPEDESGSNVRVLGPAMATLAGILLAGSIARSRKVPWPEATIASLPDWIASARGRAEEAARPLTRERAQGAWAFVTTQGYGELCHGLRWKWMEGLRTPPPPLWDILDLIGSPLTLLDGEPTTFVALERDAQDERDDDPDGDALDRRLFDRLEAQLAEGRHSLVRLRSRLPGPFAYFDHDAQSNWLLLRALTSRAQEAAEPRIVYTANGRDGRDGRAEAPVEISL